MAYSFTNTYFADSLLYIYKYGSFINTSVSIPLYKSSVIYLRYAEALNHLNKPTMAFAVLKNGLYESAIRDPNIVSPDEISISYTGPSLSDPDQDSTYTQIRIPAYCNFPEDRYGVYEGSYVHSRNLGIHERGCGDTYRDTLFIIPGASDLPTRADTIRYVDEMICNEYALETAFEGNRFHDLMRFAIRWNDENFLAERVARKHGNDPAMIGKLRDRKNWYLPYN
jgi:hypothetical protein